MLPSQTNGLIPRRKGNILIRIKLVTSATMTGHWRGTALFISRVHRANKEEGFNAERKLVLWGSISAYGQWSLQAVVERP
ncbi:hypothetical protein Tco_1273847 [Tanacetum coccineum]